MVLATLFVFSIFAAQLVRIQGFDSGSVSQAALKERLGRTVIPAVRGSILDANGTVLASSEERMTISVNQQAVCTYGTGLPTCSADTSTEAVAKAASALSPILGIPANTLVPELSGDLQYRIIAKNVSAGTWRKVQDLDIPGVYVGPNDRSSVRNYPLSTTAASLVGFVTNDQRAGGGIELLENRDLSGSNGEDVYEKGADGTPIPDGQHHLTPAVPGHDVQLTINSNIQWYAQNALAQTVQKTQALSGTVVVQSVKDAKLLAVASYPTFDPNKVGQAKGSLSNLAFTDVFEPGSTGKVVTMAAALAEGKVTPSTPVIIPSELIRGGDDTHFHDAEDHGTEYRTVAGVLAQSSNMGTMLVGETVHSPTMYSYLRKFGFGSVSGSTFPGESPGLLANYKDWNDAQKYTVMFGQGLSVTAIQATSVYQTIANGGVRVTPSLVQAVGDKDGTLVPTAKPASERVIPAHVASELTQMLEGVVSKDGTAPAAQVAGYRVAGKTGTANRAVNGVYTGNGMTASFIGYAPADDPQVVVSVIVQRPIKGTYGGTVAAPVFHDVMTYALQELRIPPTGTKRPSLRLQPATKPVAGQPGVLYDKYPDGTR